MRLDKYLSNKGLGSRKEVKKYIEEGNVIINGKVVKKAKTIFDPKKDKLYIKNKDIIKDNYIYLMMNKPKGVICQTKSLSRKTVIDLLDNNLKDKDLSPAGRLDLDTEGLVLLTNDGRFLQNIINPESNIYKKYYVKVDGNLEKEDIEQFKKGFYFKEEDHHTHPSKLEIIDPKTAFVYIKEGKYHQVKRMMKSCGKKVSYLKRVAIGDLNLDEDLKKGQYRHLTDEELSLLLREFD